MTYAQITRAAATDFLPRSGLQGDGWDHVGPCMVGGRAPIVSRVHYVPVTWRVKSYSEGSVHDESRVSCSI